MSPTSSAPGPRQVTSGSSPSSRAYAASRAAARMYRTPSTATTTYSMSSPTITARLLGSVHGVVVQISSFAPWNGPSVVTSYPTVTAGSCRIW